MKTRREFLGLGGAGLCLLAVPLASLAQQQGKVWRVVFLAPRSRPDDFDSDTYGVFQRAMRELGYVEGKNLVIEWSFADNKPDRLPELAAEMARLKVDVIVTSSSLSTRAAQKATATIPIVMMGAGDPVGTGLVKSLARPGGNTTGVSNITSDLGPKRLELMLELVPKLTRVAFLMSVADPTRTRVLESVRAAGQKRRVEIVPANAWTPQEIDNAFSLFSQQKAGALIVSLNPLFIQQRNRIAEFGARHRLPCITPDRIFAEAGCLMSYGSSLADDWRRTATYVDRIFKGAKPGDLPVEQPTKFEFVINGKTAKALGLTIPQSLLIIADKVIE